MKAYSYQLLVSWKENCYKIVHLCLQSLENDFIQETELTPEPQGMEINFSTGD